MGTVLRLSWTPKVLLQNSLMSATELQNIMGSNTQRYGTDAQLTVTLDQALSIAWNPGFGADEHKISLVL
jgi:hypothetical protein